MTPLYTYGPTGPFPELDPSSPCHRARFDPATHPLGIAFSGGGTRSFSCCIGQMQALLDVPGLLDSVGAISCVSGGSWFGSLFTFAPTSYSDSTLLGSYVDPGSWDVASLDSVAPGSLAAALPGADLLGTATDLWWKAYYDGEFPVNQVYSRSLNRLLLEPFGLGDLEGIFTLDRQSRDAIVALNPGLRGALFYEARPDRPFFIAGSTLTFFDGTGYPPYQFESTPLYEGMAQTVVAPAGSEDANGNAIGGYTIGGGSVAPDAFDTGTPSLAAKGPGYAQTPPISYPFALSEVIGSSGAAPGYILDQYDMSGIFAEFSYWPPSLVGAQPAATLSVVDGGDYENTGVVALLRRRYPLIFAFVNTSTKIDLGSSITPESISDDVSALFGWGDYVPGRSTRVFDPKQYPKLVLALRKAMHEGRAPVHADVYEIQAPNAFGLTPYKPLVVWFYNDLNMAWYKALSAAAQQCLSFPYAYEPDDYLANFPNYATVFQNADSIIALTPRQVNLLSNMWSYNLRSASALIEDALGRVERRPRVAP